MIFQHHLDLSIPDFVKNWEKIYGKRKLEELDGGALYFTIDKNKDEIKKLKNEILNYLEIADAYTSDGSLDYLFFGLPNTEFKLHKDNVYKNYLHRRLLYVVQECEKGGNYFDERQNILLKQNQLYEIEADKPHGLTKIEGKKPLIMLIMSYLKAKDLVYV
jgi:hypothetical protein